MLFQHMPWEAETILLPLVNSLQRFCLFQTSCPCPTSPSLEVGGDEPAGQFYSLSSLFRTEGPEGPPSLLKAIRNGACYTSHLSARSWASVFQVWYVDL